MNHALALMDAGDLPAGLDRFSRVLRDCYRSSPLEKWRQFVTEAVRPHPLRERVLEDPFTRRALEMPRGYAGDAPLMDLMYGEGPLPRPGTRERALLAVSAARPASLAVRHRRRVLADLIDETAARLARPARVLALAAGHLREIALSQAAARGQVEVLAIDQDRESLALIDSEYNSLGAATCWGSVRQVLAGKLDVGRFDLVYAAGLYDYLGEPVAQRLTEILFGWLEPEGTLLLPNFLPDIEDLAYMDAVMDWHLVYRNECDMLGLAATLPRDRVRRLQLSNDPARNIVFLRVDRQ
jgi:extracellular factor (EF) 3-hydroxypalmitic acid methyl ester biosynthesis protein